MYCFPKSFGRICLACLIGLSVCASVSASGAESAAVSNYLNGQETPEIEIIPSASVHHQAAQLLTENNESAAQQLLKKLNELQNLHVLFEQSVRDSKGELVDESSGRFLWMRPDLFRWDVTQPFEQSIVVKDGEQHQYDPDLEQLSIQTVSQEALTLPNILLAGDAEELEYLYKVRVIEQRAGAEEAGGVQDKQLFMLAPHDRGGELQSILLTFGDADLLSIEVVDSLEQTNRFELSVVDEPLSAGDFEIEVAEGTEIIQ